MNKLLVVLLVLAVVLTACVGIVEDSENRKLSGAYWNYSITEVEYNGMTCLIIEGTKRAGITCNWEEWRE